MGVMQAPSAATSYLPAEGPLGWIDSHIPPISTQSKLEQMEAFPLQNLLQQGGSTNPSFLSVPCQFSQSLSDISGTDSLNDLPQTATCSLCGYVTNSKKSLARHVSLRHFRQGDFACGECGKVFQTKLYLNQHMKSHGERKYMCEVCGQKFLYKHHLPRHQQAVHGAITCYNIPSQSDESRDDLPVVFESPS
ncbi:hypothetical protein ACOMHN_022988 [Nucella lapillus]